MDNRTIADWLTDYAHFLQAEGGSLYRIRAYRQAAQTIMGLDRRVSHIVEAEGRKGLVNLPGIGTHLAYTIAELVRTGEFRTWDQRDEPKEAVDTATAAGHAGNTVELACSHN